MAGFSDFESLVNGEPPSHSQLTQDVEALHPILTDRYTRERYVDFYREKHDGNAPATTEKSYDFLSFGNCLSESEAWELYQWCSASASAWIEEVCGRIHQLLSRPEATLQAFADELHSNFSVTLEAAYDDSGMGSVADRFREYWKDAAGEAIRENYSDKWSKATKHMRDICHALANGAETEIVLIKAAREHIDSLIKIVTTTLESGAGPSATEEAIFKYLGNQVVDKVSGTTWAAAMAIDVYKELHPEAAETQPRLTTDNPDEVKTELSAAFDQLEDILKSDRQAFGESLTSAFDDYRAWFNARPSRLVPRPSIDEIDWSE